MKISANSDGLHDQDDSRSLAWFFELDLWTMRKTTKAAPDRGLYTCICKWMLAGSKEKSRKIVYCGFLLTLEGSV